MEQINNWKSPIFSNPKSVGERIWGSEEILEHASGKWMLKKLFMNSGAKGGLQYHRKKDEGGILISGKLLIRYSLDGKYDLKERVINSGESFHFPPYCIHQEEALTDCLIIEVTTPHFNDRVRMEKVFGQSVEEGLPSTRFDDIVEM